MFSILCERKEIHAGKCVFTAVTVLGKESRDKKAAAKVFFCCCLIKIRFLSFCFGFHFQRRNPFFAGIPSSPPGGEYSAQKDVEVIGNQAPKQNSGGNSVFEKCPEEHQEAAFCAAGSARQRNKRGNHHDKLLSCQHGDKLHIFCRKIEASINHIGDRSGERNLQNSQNYHGNIQFPGTAHQLGRIMEHGKLLVNGGIAAERMVPPIQRHSLPFHPAQIVRQKGIPAPNEGRAGKGSRGRAALIAGAINSAPPPAGFFGSFLAGARKERPRQG